ncbi:hypothetical protein SAMN04488541_101686 [Thermoflexibacter ruber]|uniref:Uncharacterized protein n=1 Tax=Thermoflexibacter ruber TaxID=1003 RepID=A0A1I2G654_9BACT|nr:hypothetical protein SAMN04488541_101686 [Thermoflexibacter ruber]
MILHKNFNTKINLSLRKLLKTANNSFAIKELNK